MVWFFLIILRSDGVISLFPHFPRIKCSFPKGSVQLIPPFNIYRLIRTVLSIFGNLMTHSSTFPSLFDFDARFI